MDGTKHKHHKMRDGSLQSWQENQEDGKYDSYTAAILGLVEDNPGLTKNELLKIAVEQDIIKNKDSNWIAPKLFNLAKKGLIVRPKRKLCPVTKKLNFTHKAIPKKWSEQRALLLSKGIPAEKLVLDWSETESKTDSNVIHTTIMWNDGAVSCTCNDTYGRPEDHRCHHAKGMIEMKTGNNLTKKQLRKKCAQLQTALNRLEEMHNELKKDLTEFKEMYVDGR